ncbi:hypothetical protein CB1_000199004 [Camelus ferus]|nr:hypothetical protein CB1_000199004 [Camelus ferus]
MYACALVAHARGSEKKDMAAPSFPTPLYGHVGRGAFSDVYEPAEDTFLLLDALEAAAPELTGCEEGGGVPAEEVLGILERWRSPPERRRCRPTWHLVDTSTPQLTIFL